MNKRISAKVKTKRFPWLSLLTAIGVLLLAFHLVSTSFHPKIIAPGQELLSDDFGFTVVGVARLPEIGTVEGPLRPNGEFLVVDLQIANHAQRVDFQFDPRIVVVEDGEGKRIQFSEPAQKLVDPMGAEVNSLAHGEVCRRKIAFDVPLGASGQRLHLSFGGRIGELLDWFLFGDRSLDISNS